MNSLSHESLAVIAAFSNKNMDDFLIHVASFRDALRNLGRHSGTPIFTEAHERLVTIADENGCVYKPSGAGGGDIGLLFAESQTQLLRGCSQIEGQGFRIIPVKMAEQGVRVTEY